MTITVFTCVVGPTRDRLRPPTVHNPSVRYVCLTDRPTSPAPYEHVPVAVPVNGARSAELFARQIKILADHPSLGTPDVMLWHDAAFELTCDPNKVARQHLQGVDVVAFRHPHRGRIEDEGEVIARMGYTAQDILASQVATYRDAGFAEASVITSTGFSVRRMSPAIRAFNACWWDEVRRWTWRDQMSVDYALWKTEVPVGYFAGHYRDNPYAKWHAS